MVHDAKAWKTSLERFEKYLGNEKMRGDSLAEQLETKEKEMADAFCSGCSLGGIQGERCR